MWFGVNIFMKGVCSTRAEDQLVWEERILLIKANSGEAAKAQGQEIGINSECDYISGTNELIKWQFVTVDRVYQIDSGKLESGGEVFSRFLRASEAKSLLMPLDDDPAIKN